MATLPVSVEEVRRVGPDTYGVVLGLADGTRRTVIVPASLATIEAVSISAVAVAVLLDPAVTTVTRHHRGHRRYAPRTGNGSG